MLKKLFKYSKEDSLIRDSFILFAATLVLQLAAFLYHLFMGRILGPKDYGAFGAILALIYILLVLLTVIQTSVAKFVAGYKIRKEYGKIGCLLSRGLFRLIVFGVIGLILSSLVGVPLAEFLHVPYLTLMLAVGVLPFILLLAWMRGILQGLQMFKSWGFNLTVEGILKLGIGLLLVFIGFGVNGAVLGITISMIVAFGFTFIPLKRFVKIRKVKVVTRKVALYSLPVLMALISLTALYSIDMIIIKHFFSNLEAGYYAAASLLAKIAFFASTTVTLVMFPKVAELYEMKKSSKRILEKTLLFVGGICLAVTLIYFFFPELVILILFGSSYLAIKNYLWVFALALSFFSLAYALAMYNLSVNRKKFVFGLFGINLLEIVLIWYWHSSLFEVILLVTLIMFLLLVYMVLYTKYKNAKTETQSETEYNYPSV